MKTKLLKKLTSIIICLSLLAMIIPLGAITVSAYYPYYGSGYYTYTLSDGEATITGFDKSIVGDITIPSTLGDYPVTRIDGNTMDGVFENCFGLTGITIPDSIISIGDFAFAGCTGLTSITIPDSVTSIGWATFCNCTGLTSVTIPDSVISIGWSAFNGCTGLTSIVIPNSVTSIGNQAFASCSSLTNINIPDSITSIDCRATCFDWCWNLSYDKF